MSLGHVFPMSVRKRSKVVMAVVDICFIILLMQDRTLEEETDIEHLCQIKQISLFVLLQFCQ
jgi:hypothetical protein